MPIQILMPALSPTMTEGTLIKWLKAEGDTIKAGETLAEIETDKATMEIEAVDEGTLGRIVVPAGSEGVKVNELIGLILEDGEDAKSLDKMVTTLKAETVPLKIEREQEAPLASAAAMPQTTTVSQGRIATSPLAKRLAIQNNLDLNIIQGSGPQGRIIKVDVEQTLKQGASQPTPMSTGPNYVEIPLNTMRKVIAKRLTEAKQQIPHFYLSVDCQIDSLLNLRREINVTMEDQKISVNDLIIRASALALIKVPEANATWHDTVIRQHRHADVAVAVAINGGLITPVIYQAETKSVLNLSAEMRTLAEKARAGKLTPEEYQGGTFTLSNLGMYGIKQFSAILNPPQACILAVGAGETRPIAVDGTIKIATMMTCTLSVDHRAVDGTVGSRFLKALKDYIENPLALLL